MQGSRSVGVGAYWFSGREWIDVHVDHRAL